MLRYVSRIILVICLMLPHLLTFGQMKVPAAAWLFPGVSWQPAKDLRLQWQLGYNNFFRMGVFYPQGFITVHKNIVLNPAYIFAMQQNNGLGSFTEHYLMNAVIFQVKEKNLLVDNRNMLWNRFTVGDRARHYYRNRLRIMHSFRIGAVTTTPYAYNEVFFTTDFKELTRNRPAFGATCDLTSHVNLDITYIRQWDRQSGRLNLFFIAAIWQFKKS